LSFTDVTIAVAMKELNDDTLISFDSGFGKVPRIKRYENLPVD